MDDQLQLFKEFGRPNIEMSYYQRNRSRLIASATAWNGSNKTKRGRTVRSYRRRNVERIRAWNRNYAAERYEPRLPKDIPCARCKREFTRHPNEAGRRFCETCQPIRRKQVLRAYAAQNADAIKAQQRAYQERHRERLKIRMRELRQANYATYRETERRAQQKRRVAKLGNDTRLVTKKDWRRMLVRSRGECGYCGERRPLTQEHVIPVIRGGRHSVGNLLPACESCNKSKCGKFLMEWYRRRPYRWERAGDLP